jgi:voltage-gated potassium channel
VITVLYRYFARRIARNPPAPLRIFTLIVAVILYGSTGYLYFELPENPTLTWPDGIWYSVVTMTTVGYGDYFPKSPGGRFLVAVPLMFFGIGLLGYVLSVAATALVQAKTKELHGMSSFHRLKGHLVIINFPSLGKIERLLEELEGDPSFGKGRDIVLIDEDLAELPPALLNRGLMFIRGNPSRDETLTRAAVDVAAHAIVLSKKPGDPHSDDQNIAITLAIEGRTPRVHTVVECVDFSAQELLRKAGCDGIVCTSRFDAHFLSHELLNPGVQEIVEELTTNLRGQQVHLTRYGGRGPVAYSQLVETCKKSGHLAIGIQRDNRVELNVDAAFHVQQGDTVITIGKGRMAGLGDTQ